MWTASSSLSAPALTWITGNHERPGEDQLPAALVSSALYLKGMPIRTLWRHTEESVEQEFDPLAQEIAQGLEDCA
jgi:hypothetical protein